MSIPDYQQRVITEANELQDKISKLKAFFITDTFANSDPHSRDLLKIQFNAMATYAHILDCRIAKFPID